MTIVDSTQRIALVTGANHGLGFGIGRGLAPRGHTTFLGALDPAKGEAAASELGRQALTVLLSACVLTS